MGDSGETVFVRQATGLVREVGLGSAVFFCLMYATQLGGMMTLMPYYWGYGDFIGNLWGGIAIGFLVIVLVNTIYAHFSSAMPRSGGDYVFLGRTIHPFVGFGPNFILTSIMIWWSASNMVFMSYLMQTLLSLFYPQNVLAPIYTTWGSFALGFILWVCVAVLAMTRLRVFLRLNAIAWIAQFVVMGLLVYYILSAAGNFPALFNSWALKYVPSNPDMYHTIINNATAAGFQINPPPEGPLMPQTLAWASAIVGFFLPYTAGIVWIAGEVKKAESGVRQQISMQVATLLALIVLVCVGVTWVYTVDPRFMAAFTYLGSVSGLPLSAFYWSFFPAIMPTWVVVAFLVTYLLALVAVTYQNQMVFSRNVFAWSFDRLIPSAFSNVSERSKQPVVAFGTALGITLVVGVLAFTVSSIFTYVAALFLLMLFNLFILSVAGVVFPYVRKDMFEQMPLKARVAGIPVLSIVSLASLVLLGWVTSAYFTNPGYTASYGVTVPSLILCAFIWVLAFGIFFGSRTYNKRHGVDLSRAFATIPPA